MLGTEVNQQMDKETLSTPDLDKLEQRIDELVSKCSRLELENRSLRAQAAELQSNKAELMEKNETARARVEAMIYRLKALEEE